jgi:hypothetical protein
MKKCTIAGLAILMTVIIILGGSIYFYFLRNKPVDPRVDFQFYDQFTADPCGFRDRSYQTDMLYTWFWLLKKTTNDYDKDEYLLKQFNTKILSIDWHDLSEKYPDRYFVITLGRELADLRYTRPEDRHKSRGSVMLDITFKEEYCAQTVYVYAIDKVLINDGMTLANHFYYMKGEERVFWGYNLKELVEPPVAFEKRNGGG